jgi:hypothetical protein
MTSGPTVVYVEIAVRSGDDCPTLGIEPGQAGDSGRLKASTALAHTVGRQDLSSLGYVEDPHNSLIHASFVLGGKF